jgi:hypothetical protein
LIRWWLPWWRTCLHPSSSTQILKDAYVEGAYVKHRLTMKINPQCEAPNQITLHPQKSDWMDNLLTRLATVLTILCQVCNLVKKLCCNGTYETYYCTEFSYL